MGSKREQGRQAKRDARAAESAKVADDAGAVAAAGDGGDGGSAGDGAAEPAVAEPSIGDAPIGDDAPVTVGEPADGGAGDPAAPEPPPPNEAPPETTEAAPPAADATPAPESAPREQRWINHTPGSGRNVNGVTFAPIEIPGEGGVMQTVMASEPIGSAHVKEQHERFGKMPKFSLMRLTAEVCAAVDHEIRWNNDVMNAAGGGAPATLRQIEETNATNKGLHEQIYKLRDELADAHRTIAASPVGELEKQVKELRAQNAKLQERLNDAERENRDLLRINETLATPASDAPVARQVA